MSSLPSEYNGAITDWERQWDWLSGDGYQAYYRIKWFQLQAKNNEKINTPVGKQMWFWLQEQTGFLDGALLGIHEAVKRGDLAAFNRFYKVAEDHTRYAKAAQNAHDTIRKEWKPFIRNTKPEKVGKFVEWFDGWEVTEDTWPSLHNMKKAMATLATLSFGNYLKSYKEMVKVWTPIIDEKFLKVRPYIKHFEMRTLVKQYTDEYKKLKSAMYQRR